MSNETVCLPGPEEPGRREGKPGVDGSHASDSPEHDAGGPARSEGRCLAALARLPGLIVMGQLTTAQANSMRASFVDILRWHRTVKGSREQQHLNDSHLRSLLRSNPDMLAML